MKSLDLKAVDNLDVSFNAKLFYKELLKRKVGLTNIQETSLIVANYKNHKEILYDIYTSLIPFPIGWIIDDKYYSKKFLERKGFRVAKGKVFSEINKDTALEYAQSLGFPIVLKPTGMSHGEFVFMDIFDEKELSQKIDSYLSKNPSYFLVEKQGEGEEYRLFITKSGFFAAVHRIPANVKGDGVNNLLILVQKENYIRMNPRKNCLCEIKLDEITFDYMEKNNISLDYIPRDRETVFLRHNSNVSTGGNCFDVTDKVHPIFLDLAKRILFAFDIPYIGIDLICPNISRPPKNNFFICEVNSAPGLSLHMMPEQGESYDVANELANLLFPETK